MIESAVQFLRLFALAVSLSHDPALSIRVAADAMEASSDVWTRRWLVFYGWHEGRWDVDAEDATGWAQGTMQVASKVWGRPPRDRVGQFEMGVRVLSALEGVCGSRRRALVAYHVGNCHGASSTVDWRCDALGGCGK